MTDKPVLRLVVDSTGAQADLEKFDSAMTRAAATAEKSVATMTTGGGSMSRVGKNWENAQAKIDPVMRAMVIQQREVEKATLAGAAAARLGIATEAQVATQIQRTTAYFGQQVAAARSAGSAYVVGGRSAGTMGASLSQLSFQLNDVVSGLLMGQRPFQIFAQQGGQIFQIWQMNNNIFKDVATTIGNFIKTPFGLVTTALLAAGAAGFAFFKLFQDDAPTAEEALKTHEDLLSKIKTAYGNAKIAAGEFYEQSKKITTLQAQQDLISAQRQLSIAGNQAINNLTVSAPRPEEIPLGVPASAIVTDNREATTSYQELNKAIEAFNESTRDATAVQGFRDAVAAIGIAAQNTNPELAKQANEIINNTKGLGDWALAALRAEAALRLLSGTATESDRKLLGLHTATVSQTNAYASLIQRTKDRIDELNLEAQTAGKTADAVIKLKLQHDADRAAKKAGVPVNQKVIDQLKDELALAERARAVAEINAQIKFDHATIGLSDEDVQIAERLRGIYKNDVPAALNSSEAAAMRLNGSFRTLEAAQTKGVATVVKTIQTRQDNDERNTRLAAA